MCKGWCQSCQNRTNYHEVSIISQRMFMHSLSGTTDLDFVHRRTDKGKLSLKQEPSVTSCLVWKFHLGSTWPKCKVNVWRTEVKSGHLVSQYGQWNGFSLSSHSRALNRVWFNTIISHSLSQIVVLFTSCNCFNIHLRYLLHVGVTHGLCDTFPLVIARSRANGIHMAPVLFILRVNLWVYKTNIWTIIKYLNLVDFLHRVARVIWYCTSVEGWNPIVSYLHKPRM